MQKSQYKLAILNKENTFSCPFHSPNDHVTWDLRQWFSKWSSNFINKVKIVYSLF